MKRNTRYELHPPSHLTQIHTPKGSKPQETIYYFEKCTKKEILTARLQRKSALILAYEGCFYIAYVPAELLILPNSLKDEHLCSYCNRCYASSDEKGGCVKIRDFLLSVKAGKHTILNTVSPPPNVSMEEYIEMKRKAYIQAVKESKRIEKYPFIEIGLEGINLNREFLLVSKCNHFVADPPSRYSNKSEIRAVKNKFRHAARDHLQN